LFKNPFSFNGRIRRTEFGISFIIYLAIYFYIINPFRFNRDEPPSGLILLALIPLLWFLWAQGAKRCHDINRSGWWQIIPFYFLWLLFEDGNPAENIYGPDPKGRVYEYDGFGTPPNDQENL
jgi:uncharacterized membrane protein YhaH (DUF805 family)